MSRAPRILVVEDEAGVRDALVEALHHAAYETMPAAGLADARALLERESVDCVLTDLKLGDGSGLELLREIRAREGAPPVVVLTAYGDSERTIEATRAGAFDYVTKPFELHPLLATLARAMRRAPGGAIRVERSAPVRGGLLGQSATMIPVFKAIGRASASRVPVLITGETGTGKSLVARAIHDHSDRADGPFVSVNLAGLPPTLIEAELFGHEKGAFTGADRRRTGRFALADGGTLFLDEIGELDGSLQAKLLQLLQDGTYELLGSSEPVRVDVRVIAATHREVRPDRPRGTLRADLYYRLAVVEIEVPPLRARRGDIPLLAQHALQKSDVRAITESAMELLRRAPWPGNVRQLLHVVQRAAVMCPSDVIDADDLPHDLARSDEDEATLDVSCRTLPEAVAELERRMIVAALEESGGNRSKAARRLGIHRQLLYTKIEHYGIGGHARAGADDPEE